MVTEENFIKDSASLAVKDYCNSPIKTENIAYCKNNGSNNGLINEEYGVYYMCVDTLRNYGYYDKSFLSGVAAGYAKDVYEELLDYLRPQGVKAYLDIVIKDY